MYCTSTMHANRKWFLKGLVPPNASMPQGSNRFASSSTHNLTAVWWKDRKDVFVMSTLHKNAVEKVMKRPKGAKEKSTPCLSMIVDYNQNMGGVDLTDQYLSYYSLTTRRTPKWWKKVFWHLIDMCAKFMGYLSIKFFKLHNTHKLFCLKPNYWRARSAITYLACLSRMPSLPLYQRQRACCRWWSPPREALFLQALQAPAMCCLQSEKVTGTGKRMDKKTKNYYPKCNVFLCLGEFFEAYHTQTSYK